MNILDKLTKKSLALFGFSLAITAHIVGASFPSTQPFLFKVKVEPSFQEKFFELSKLNSIFFSFNSDVLFSFNSDVENRSFTQSGYSFFQGTTGNPDNKLLSEVEDYARAIVLQSLYQTNKRVLPVELTLRMDQLFVIFGISSEKEIALAEDYLDEVTKNISLRIKENILRSKEARLFLVDHNYQLGIWNQKQEAYQKGLISEAEYIENNFKDRNNFFLIERMSTLSERTFLDANRGTIISVFIMALFIIFIGVFKTNSVSASDGHKTQEKTDESS